MNILKPSSLLAAAFVGLFAGSAHAAGIVEVKVPFSFVVRGEEFPAGRYEVLTDSDGSLLVHGTDSADQRSMSFALSIPADGRDPLGSNPALVFTKYENQFRLSQIWESGSDGRQLIGAQPVHRIARAEPRVAPEDALEYVLAATTAQ